ncbi:glycosyltransferase [Sandaracinobacteroides saxicola]|uniref:Glycosyltransferase n=1 Tax=Sandaracinobacteroides saxicola TaxID=2759707 RepID=A0A7G5IFE2_9SPHN|nr:glycosyltransferase [Sandaracinobacteroides saxicola]QMW22084.1 glycosyltransferase [Sandaracinobacteroides saxicola]
MARLLLYLHDLSATGVTRNALALAAALASDHDITLATGRATGTLAAEAAGAIDLGGHGPRAAHRLRTLARALSPALALSAGNRGHPFFFAALAGLPHLRRLYRFSNDIDHRDSRGRRRWWKPLADSAQLALLRHSADHLIAVSQPLAADPRLAAIPLTLIPNSIDIAATRGAAALPCPHPWATDQGPPFIIGIGRLTPQKDFATLIAAFALLRRQRALRLLILGDGPQRPALDAQVAALGLTGWVSLPGSLPNPMPLLARAAVFGLPSLWEGASNALLEALALNTPIVASRTAGNAVTVLDHGAHGLLVPPGDPAALAQALLLQTGAEAIRPGTRASHFSRETALDQWRRLLANEAARLPPLAPPARFP